MHLTVRDVAAIFEVPESQIYRWVADDQMPVVKIDGQNFFNRADLLEWATTRRIRFTPKILDGKNGPDPEHFSLVSALEFGGVVLTITGDDRNAVLSDMMSKLKLPPGSDRAMLLDLFLTRENRGSTAVGEGIAIPHPQHPVILPIPEPLLTICYLAKPVDFRANDGLQIHTLFTLICPSIRSHLQLLARVAIAIRDQAFREVLRRQGSSDEVMAEARRIESSIARSRADESKGVRPA